MVGIQPIEHAQTEHRLRIEGERIGLQTIHRCDRNLPRSKVGRRSRTGAIGGRNFTRLINCGGEPFELGVARHPAGHRLQAQPETRGDGRRAGVAAGPRDEHLRCAERAGEIMRGRPDAKIEPGQPQIGADLGREPRIGCGRRRPHALIEAPEHHQVRLLQPRFQETPDEDARVSAIGRPHMLPLEQVAEHGHGVLGRDRHRSCSRRGFDLGEQLGRHAAITPPPRSIIRQAPRRRDELAGELREAERLREHPGDRVNRGAQPRPGSHRITILALDLALPNMRVETVQTSGWSWAAEH